MWRAISIGLAASLAAGPALPQSDDTATASFDRIVLGGGTNRSLAAGSIAIRSGDYEDGIRLTLLGLEDQSITPAHRAAGLSNLCAAYAAQNLPDTAIEYCTESIAIDSDNWRAYSNRSYAYWLKGMYPEATFDLDAATAISPRARQVAQIRGMLNEARLRPNIIMEDLQ